MSENITRKKVMTSLFWAYCENISAQFVSFVVTIVLARLLAPSDYGTIALVTVFINIANVFVSSSFCMSLVQKKDADELDYNTIFWFNFVLAIVLYMALYIGAPQIGKYYDDELLIIIIRVLALRIPLSAYNSVQTAYVSNKMVFRKSFFSTFLGAALSGAIGIGAAYFSKGVWALIAQSISNVIFNTIFLAMVVKWKPKCMFSYERLKKLIGFGWKLLVTGLMFTGYSELRTLVIGKRYSTDDLGYYNKGFQLPQFIASNIDSTITKVMFPALSKSQDNKENLVKMTRRSAKTSAYIMTPILFGLAVVGNNVVGILLTDKWLPCVPYMQLMCIVWWLQPTQSCSIQAIKAVGKSDLYLKIEIISKIFGISLLIAAIRIFNTPFSIALTMVLGQFFAMLLYGIYVSKYIGYRLKDQIQDLAIPAILASCMGIVVYIIGMLIEKRMVALPVQIMVGAMIYVGLSVILKVEEFQYLFGLILKQKKRRNEE